MTTPIYHIVTEEEYNRQRSKEHYIHESLNLEGFIHCSFEEQINGVLKRYFKNADSLMLLRITTEKLTAKYVIEPSTGSVLYPHVYGPINWDSVEEAYKIIR
jgi:uncharacterized protein (DUF952 family)